MPFLLWSLFTLAVNAPALGAPPAAIAAAYWLRLISHLLLLPALLVLLTDATCAAIVRHGMVAVTIFLSVGGIVQLLILPDLSVLNPASGWDPHTRRLVSSWLDPNFLGIFYALMLPYLVSRLKLRAAAAAQWHNIWLLLAISLSGASLILTQSRSALLALAAAIGIFSPLLLVRFILPARRVAAVSASLLIIGSFSFGGYVLRERLAGLVQFDDTVALRARALQTIWPLAAEHAWLGVGYNAFQFAAQRAGLISRFTIHSRAGADNSLLTLWVTTGLPGLILFLLPLAVSAQFLLRDAVRSHSQSAGALISLTALLIHSQFVNSLLYAHLLITLAIILALALTAPTH
ncbi:MAG: O-antigen ligase family protein [Candidatus Andersenbacteria bacterium]|nr:O-antigen ligase family protein [Candidatus Andersenbacteria bacterium]